MAFIPVPSVVQCNIRYELDAEQVQNTVYGQFSGPPTPAQVTGLANAVMGWQRVHVLPLLSAGLRLVEVNAVDLTSASGVSITAPALITDVGGVAGEAEPNNVSLCVSFRTPFRGRSFRGRNYLAGIPDSQTIGSRTDAAFTSAVETAYEALQPAMNAAGALWVVVSRYTAGLPRPNGIGTLVTAVLVTDAVLDSQRRRLPGRG